MKLSPRFQLSKLWISARVFGDLPEFWDSCGWGVRESIVNRGDDVAVALLASANDIIGEILFA